MAMQYEPGSEKVAIMNGDGAGIPVVKSLSPVGDPEVKRTRKNLLIILIISLVLSVISLITMPILGIVITPKQMKIQQGVQIGQTLTSILFYSIGIFFAHQYHQTGLRVFGWLCRICLIILSIVIVALIIIFVITCIYMNNTNDGVGALAGAIMILILLIMLCLTALIVTVIIIKFTFKLATLIGGNKRSTTGEV